MRFDGQPTLSTVSSADGTKIGFWTSGQGPPLVLVHGTTADHASWDLVRPHLQPHFTLHAVDRRGRGASGDHHEYDIVREYEDIAAVVNEVAEASGSRVHLFGHSYGATCALGGAALSPDVRSLMLYEPELGEGARAVSAGLLDRLEASLAEGRREATIEIFYRELLHVTDAEIARLKAVTTWSERVAAARTIPRELRAVDPSTFDARHAARVTVPTLVLLGENSPDFAKADVRAVAAALPDVRTVVIEGQEHIAHYLAADVLASHLVRFAEEHP